MAVNDNRRPNPDALLAMAEREGRGRLKVFLGAAPGVGKTFEMLNEGRRRAAGGARVLVGLLETHGRAETAAQLGDLPLLPRRRVEYRGQALEEFDLDAALNSRPDILLLDELAHTNAPGSRHPKRWQDVEELRAAGIEVWTTMNVQHLESLSEDVARITGIRVRETVPDAVLAGADAVELIDIPPAELLERLKQGKVYRPEQASRAMKGFFREGNLAALRQIALRRTAERVDADVTDYMRANAIEGPWPSGERVMALIGRDEMAEEVVRQARRLADALRAPLLAVHVEMPGGAGLGPDAALRLAERLGAGAEIVPARDLPSAVLAHARARNVTHLVIGRSRSSWWRRATGRTLAATLARQGTDFSLHLIPGPAPAAPLRRREALGLPGWVGWAAVPALITTATGLSLLVQDAVPEGGIGMIYLAAVVALAAAFGPLPAAAGALLAFLVWDFLFLLPRFAFEMSGLQEVVGAAIFISVALLLAGTTGQLGRSVSTARARLFGMRRLVEFSRKLGAASSEADLMGVLVNEAYRLAGRPVCLLLPLDGEPVVRAAQPVEIEPDAASMAAARWAMAKGTRAGFATDALPAASWQFHPLRTAHGTIGLLALQMDGPGISPGIETEHARALEALIDQGAIALEHARLMEEQARQGARVETEALRSALLASMGHDLRTPLTAIRGALETLRLNDGSLSPAVRQDLLSTAEEETQRLTRYLNNIMDIVKLENGQITPRREPVDVADALHTAAARAERQGRHARFEPGDRLPMPQADPLLLDQVLGNLVDNAVKFSNPESTITLAARREGAELVITVEDEGIGIPENQLAQVFDPFFRVRRGDKAPAGSGLGLAISQGLVHAMGGRISAESPIRHIEEGHGKGTRMTIRLPL
ncbi:sensor histidine kinase KdpD [Acetobacteraceae bacterium H6797]|nr:sensor histidine kinase KdpD [Acetobacteraceae bacterium H6797]